MANRINTDELNEKLIIASVRKNKTIVPANNPVEVVRDTEPETTLDNEQPKQKQILVLADAPSGIRNNHKATIVNK
jgi:hypothetical protein